jgi:hypothetical protein
MDAAQARGACLCGAVSFTAGLPSKWVAHCHCTRCQRAHGAAFVTWVGVDEPHVVLRDPDHLLRWHEAREGGSRGFCSKCGSPMFFKAAAWPGELHIARALFTDPLDREPQVHAYYDTHVGWVALGDDLPRKPAPP